MRKLITSALPYVNNVPHLGNIIGCVLSADVYARFCRLRGYDTLYVCGTDEYGTATETKARELGISPRDVCDRYHAIHRDIYRDFNISFDVFGRTSTPEQTRIAQEIFLDIDRNGLISEQTTQRIYCPHCDMFLADRYVEGVCPECGFADARGDQCDSCGKLLEPELLESPRCKLCGGTPEQRETAHLYLQLDRLQDRLSQWAQVSWQQGTWTHNAIQTTQGWLDRGLQPRPITRDLDWGIPVPRPGYEHKVFYVWFDAPIGYISITAREREDWREWWQNPADVQLYQFMAKDNIPFHTVIFPASLLATGKPWTMLHHINSTEYLNYEDTKFSKSRNIGVFGDDVRKIGIATDLWRFYLLANRPERTDTSFSWQDFIEKTNTEFIDNIGNLVNRTLVFLVRNFDGRICDQGWSDAHHEFVAACRRDFAAVTDSLERVRLRDAMRQILAIGNAGNKFFQDMAPWDRVASDRPHAHATVSVLAYLVRSLARALSPYMPATGARMLAMLQQPDSDWRVVGSFAGLDGHMIGQPEILYRKLDAALAATLRERFSGAQAEIPALQLQVGQITAVAAHPDADHLYCLDVDLGDAQPRSIVAGLVKQYSPAQLHQRKVLVLANLQPATIRGVPSNGMVLVCEKRNKLELLDVSACSVGQTAVVPDDAVRTDALSLDQFKAAGLRMVDGRLQHAGRVCEIGGQPVVTSGVKNGKVR